MYNFSLIHVIFRRNDFSFPTIIIILGNYRSAITDATNAKKLKPDHLKALLRGTGIKYRELR